MVTVGMANSFLEEEILRPIAGADRPGETFVYQTTGSNGKQARLSNSDALLEFGDPQRHPIIPATAPIEDDQLVDDIVCFATDRVGIEHTEEGRASTC